MSPDDLLRDACIAWCLSEVRGDVRRVLVDAAVACVLAGERSSAVAAVAGLTASASWSEVDLLVAEVVRTSGIRVPEPGSAEAVRASLRVAVLPLAREVGSGARPPGELVALVGASWGADDDSELAELRRLAVRDEVLRGVAEEHGEDDVLLRERADIDAAVVEAARALVARLA
ncbi:hypothetical protein [Cellulomonas sp. HZM]|uniref:hypothetical protein n=1 Tax=Cellulomonas sp. HZM TaxID=1454010 RepID=UPI0004934686|nr:hypothetical protein [Cellulomonas sp. HZM]